MATASIPVKQLEDITECPICAEVFADSRVLPCIHTFCLRCIKKLGTDKNPGDKISCPLCRKECVIPEGGIPELPKNLFVEKLLEVKSLTDILHREDSTCDVCSEEDETPKKNKERKAVVYCIDCRKNMCKQCFGCHQQFKLPGTHKLIERNKSPLQADDLLLKFPETTCEKHPDKNLEIYCFECKTAVCMMCYIKGHNSHKCSDVKEVADDLTAHLCDDAKGIAGKVDDCKAMLKKIAEEDRQLRDQVKERERAIEEKAERQKKLIDEHTQEMRTKLTAAETRQLKANETVKEELVRQVVVMEGFIRYSEELKQKGTACDIAKVADALHARGEELLQFDVEVDLPADYNFTEVKFEATLSEDDVKKVFGDVDITFELKDYAVDKLLKSSKLALTFPNNGGSVAGMATLGEELFVVRWSYPHIQVYQPNTNNVNVQRNLNIGSGTNTFRGLASCEFNKCLYVSDVNAAAIHKVSPVTNNKVKQWSVNGQPYGVSVNSARNVMVACYNTHKLQEFTTEGEIVREIQLQQPDVTSPAHVVQLRSGEYGLTTHRGSGHCYCVVDTDGKLVKSGAMMNTPQGFAVHNGAGKVLVAEQGNSRLALLSAGSLAVEELPATFNCGFNGPYCVHFDKSARTLYVGEWNACRIMCFKKE